MSPAPIRTSENSTITPAGELADLLARRVHAYLGTLPREWLIEALAAPDAEMLGEVLVRGALERENDPIGRARLQGYQRRVEMIEQAGGTVSVDELAGQEGVTPAAIRQRIRRGALLAIQDARGHRIPRLQLGEDGRVLRGLGEILKVMEEPSPWMRLQWLMEPHTQLGGRAPIELIRDRSVDPMLKALAETLGEQGGG